MKQIVLDTETTGLEPNLGHRIIEIAAVELRNRQVTGSHFQRYLNPEREIDAAAQEVHGMSLEFLADKPRFRDVVQEFLDYVQGAELIIHNAPFDVAFLDRELSLLELPPISHYCPQITDTLRMAKDLNPGKRASLDALCERYQVDNSQRALHGALLDARLLAEVYLAMTRGQETLLMEVAQPTALAVGSLSAAAAATLPVIEPSAGEIAAHEAMLEAIDKESKGKCLWKALAGGAATAEGAG